MVIVRTMQAKPCSALNKGVHARERFSNIRASERFPNLAAIRLAPQS